MRRLALLSLQAALGACGYSEAELAQQPIAWTVTYPAPWQGMVTCIGLGMANEYRIVPEMHPDENRARLMLDLADIRGRAPWGVYDVKGKGPNTEVSLRHQAMPTDMTGRLDRARDIADRCGRTGG